MIRRKALHKMTNERFAAWFEKFKEPYRQTKFIHSYKSLENEYTELVIKHLLTFGQRAKVRHFLRSLPKMSNRRFGHLLERLRKDSTILYQYSSKDFTQHQHMIIQFYLLRNYCKENFRKIY